MTPLHRAAAWGQVDVAQLLLSAGAELNAEDNEGRTPLDLATDKNLDDMARLLKEHGRATTQGQ